MTVNQIKTGELLIKDKTQCPWIVGYYAKDATETGPLTGTINPPTKNFDILIDTPIAQWKYGKPYAVRPNDYVYMIAGQAYLQNGGKQAMGFDSTGSFDSNLALLEEIEPGINLLKHGAKIGRAMTPYM
jgi:hypothetical protein